MDKTENEKNLIKWTPIIQKCRSSGIGVRPWCRENNVSEKQFYYWDRRIKAKNFETQKETQPQNKANFVEIQPPIDSSINISIPTFRADMVIHVGNNVLELSNTVSENLLSMVLKVMSNVK
jgi:hypothetical protein